MSSRISKVYTAPKNILFSFECNWVAGFLPAGLIKSLNIDLKSLEKAIKPVGVEPLIFKTIKEGVILKPLYDIHRERYVVLLGSKQLI